MKMENLRDLKDVIVVVYAKMVSEVPMRSDLAFRLVDLTKKSYLKFMASYVDFEKIIGADEDLYAHWLNVQFQVMTLLDGDDTLLVNHTNMVYQTLLGTPAGSTSDLLPKEPLKKTESLTLPPRSTQIALAFRVFLDNIEVVEETVNPGAPPAPRVIPAQPGQAAQPRS